MAKVYCTGCKEKGYIYYRIPVAGLLGEDVWVHWCGKPTREFWESMIKTCEECFREFSNPWELICRKCHKLLLSEAAGENEVQSYRSWGRIAPVRPWEALRGL